MCRFNLLIIVRIMITFNYSGSSPKCQRPLKLPFRNACRCCNVGGTCVKIYLCSRISKNKKKNQKVALCRFSSSFYGGFWQCYNAISIVYDKLHPIYLPFMLCFLCTLSVKICVASHCPLLCVFYRLTMIIFDTIFFHIINRLFHRQAFFHNITIV